MEVSTSPSLNCPAGLHGPAQCATHNFNLAAFASHSPSASRGVEHNKTLTRQTSFDGHPMPVMSQQTRNVTSAAPPANALVHPHKKSTLWQRVKKAVTSCTHFRFQNRAGKPSSVERPSTSISAETSSFCETKLVETPASTSENETNANRTIHCCELERRSEALVNHYKKLFDYRPEGVCRLLEQRKRLVTALTPCTFVKSSDQWKRLDDVLQNVINADTIYSKSDYEGFQYAGDLFISAHRFMQVKFGSNDQILTDPRSNIALPFPSKLVNWLSPATESSVFSNDDDPGEMINLSSIWFVYVDANLLTDSKWLSGNEYDRYAKQLVVDLFEKGNLGLVGDHHNLIVPLIIDLDSTIVNIISRIPKTLRPFCAVFTGQGLYLGRGIFEFVNKVFSFLLNELFIQTPIALSQDFGNESLSYKPNENNGDFKLLRVTMFLYYMDLRLLSVMTKFICFEIQNQKSEENNEPFLQITQHLMTLIEFGTSIIDSNSNVLLQCILQNRYQFKPKEYWIHSTAHALTVNKFEKDELKEITNSLESTFGKINHIISTILKINKNIPVDLITKSAKKLSLSFLHIFFQECDFCLNEEITVVHFDVEMKQYIKRTEKVTLGSLKDILLFSHPQAKQLPISFVDFFQLVHLVLEELTPTSILHDWIPVLHCEMQLIFNKLLWVVDSQSLTCPDFYFTYPIPLGKERSEFSWGQLLKALNVIVSCCERMKLHNNDLLFITACEVLYQIFLPDNNFTNKAANKQLDPKWRLIEFRASRTITQELLFRTEFMSIIWEGNIFKLLLMNLWEKPPNITKVEELISFLNNLLKRGFANLIDNDAGILRFNGIIAPHAAIREPGSSIALVNDARFDSLHFMIPRLLFRPNQLADNFTDLQKHAWDANPLRFLIQTQLEKSDPQESYVLAPPWQYSTEPFSTHFQRQEQAAAIRSDEHIRTALAISQDDGDETIDTVASIGARDHRHLRSPLAIPLSQNQSKFPWLDLQTTSSRSRQPQSELRHTQGPLSYQVVSHKLAAAAPDVRSNPEQRAVSEMGPESHASNTGSKATSNLTVANPLAAGEELPQSQVQSQAEEVRTAFLRGDEEAAFARGAQSMAPDPRSRKVQPPTVASYRGEREPPVEGEQPDSALGIDIPDAGSISSARSQTQSSTHSELPAGIVYSRSLSDHAQS